MKHGIVNLGRKLKDILIEPIVKFDTMLSRGSHGWMVRLPSLVLYVTLPYAIILIGLFGTSMGTLWICRKIL